MLDRIVRVNMSSLEVTMEKLPEGYRNLSGRGLTSRVVVDEVNPEADPLGPQNKLVLACGLLAGTGVSSSGRLSVGAKSPLTGGIKESNAGGIAAYKMARLGIRAIIVEGMSKTGQHHVLVLDKNSGSLKPGGDLSMLGVYDKAQRIYDQYGSKVGAVIIGPAGERRQVTAGITNNDPSGHPGRYCGRGGLGAVMGSKGLLAVILNDAGASPIGPVRREQFMSRAKQIARWIKETPQTAEVFPKYGTAAMLDITDAIGGLPTRNFSTGTFEGAEKINGYALYNTIVSRGGQGTPTHSCMPGCHIKCSNIFPGRDGNAMVSPLEYETIGMVGANCGIDDLDVIARMNYICNDYGVDTIEVGCALAVAMEAGLMPFGDSGAALAAVEEMAKDTFLGKIMASGVVTAGRVLGVSRVPAVKGQGMPAYDPRAIKGTGVTYATSPMGADHTAGNTVRLNIRHSQREGQVRASQDAQLGSALMDCLGLCVMLGTALKDRELLAELVSSRFGRDVTLEILLDMARETLRIERAFNRGAGLTAAHDRLPEFFYHETNPVSGSVFDINREDLEQ